VLSACESALGRATLAEGVLGIASSFVSAGSRAVVASLWQVDDRTTAELMHAFLSGARGGEEYRGRAPRCAPLLAPGTSRALLLGRIRGHRRRGPDRRHAPAAALAPIGAPLGGTNPRFCMAFGGLAAAEGPG
jgi:hypothetical protein